MELVSDRLAPTDRPNSKVTDCPQEVFHIPYDPVLGRYQVRVSTRAF
jgi:hypothetical protein